MLDLHMVSIFVRSFHSIQTYGKYVALLVVDCNFLGMQSVFLSSRNTHTHTRFLEICVCVCAEQIFGLRQIDTVELIKRWFVISCKCIRFHIHIRIRIRILILNTLTVDSWSRNCRASGTSHKFIMCREVETLWRLFNALSLINTSISHQFADQNTTTHTHTHTHRLSSSYIYFNIFAEIGRMRSPNLTRPWGILAKLNKINEKCENETSPLPLRRRPRTSRSTNSGTYCIC